MTFTTQFNIGDKIRATRRNAYEDFSVDQIRVGTVVGCSILAPRLDDVCIQYRYFRENGTPGWWYAESECQRLDPDVAGDLPWEVPADAVANR